MIQSITEDTTGGNKMSVNQIVIPKEVNATYISVSIPNPQNGNSKRRVRVCSRGSDGHDCFFDQDSLGHRQEEETVTELIKALKSQGFVKISERIPSSQLAGGFFINFRKMKSTT